MSVDASSDSISAPSDSSAKPANGFRGLEPYLFALVTMIVAYLAAHSLSGQRMLAVALAATTALAAFILVRLIQLRGKLTLALTVFGFPLLIGLAFASFHALNPFFKRQRSITHLKNAGLNYSARAADEYGEWRRSRSGDAMLPTWLANRIGPDCLAELRSIEGEVGVVQSIRFEDLDRTHLYRLHLFKSEPLPTIAPEFTEWLNKLNSPKLHFQLESFTEDDCPAMARLTQPFRAHLQIDHRTGDLSKLTSAKGIEIRGITLEPRQAKELAQLPNLSYLKLTVRKLHAEAIRALDRQPILDYTVIELGALDAQAWDALPNLPSLGLNLGQVDVSTLTPRPAGGSNRALKYLTWSHSGATIAGARRLVQHFNCEELILHVPLKQEEVDSLWINANLREVRIYQWGKGWNSYYRSDFDRK